MITAKEAAKIAVDYFNDFYSEYNYSEIRVEEVELSNGIWLITLGFLDRVTTDGGFGLSLPKRRYKTFEINASSGEVKSMKIRMIE